MMTLRCPGCRRSFKGTKGLQLHHPHCSQILDKIVESSRRFRQKVEHSEALKMARQQGRDIGEERQTASRESDNEAVSRS
jgi:hypothetical protein